MYKCEIPGCNHHLAIRSTIKSEGEFKGKKCCHICKQKYDYQLLKAKESKPKPIPKITQKTKEKRAAERSELPAFFERAISLLRQKPVCENCGCNINAYLHPVNNCAHIIAKQHFKEVMTHPQNLMFLCTEKDHPYDKPKSCHGQYDNKVKERPAMPVFPLSVRRYNAFKEQIKSITTLETEILNGTY